MLIGAADKILCKTLQQRVKEDISKNFQEELEKVMFYLAVCGQEGQTPTAVVIFSVFQISICRNNSFAENL